MTKTAAIVTIKKASKMSPLGRQEIARWLRNQAKWLVKHGPEYCDTFHAKYYYESGKK